MNGVPGFNHSYLLWDDNGVVDPDDVHRHAPTSNVTMAGLTGAETIFDFVQTFVGTGDDDMIVGWHQP